MHPLLFSSKPCPVRLPRHTHLTVGRGGQGGSSLRGFGGGASLSCINMIGKGELLITIMSSLAQEESRSISEDVTWGHRKRFTVNFLTKETKANEGEVPQYYVENNHEAIISPQVFDWVQEEIKRRRIGRGRYSGVSIFSSKIKCGQCGGWYGAKVWHSTDKYRRTIYRCNDKFKSHCKTPHLTEDDIKEAFVRAVNRLIENKADVLDSIILLKERLTDTEALEEERDRLSTDLSLLADKVQQLIAENARVAQNQDDYDRNYNKLVSRYEAVKTQYDKTCEAIQYRKARSRQMDNFIQEVREQELIKEFDARLWGSLVDFITVYSKDDIRVTFKDGTEIRA